MPCVQISANPRIHIGLVDLAGISQRSYCGVGFSVSGLSTKWSIYDAENISFDGVHHLDAAAQNDLDSVTRHLQQRMPGGFHATLKEGPDQHIGLGTKTSLLLALIAGVNELKQLNLSQREIQFISGRGGASGIGINLFFCGGIVWDGGHPAADQEAFRPSSALRPNHIPPLLARWQFPSQWAIGLVLPACPSFAGANERTFFDKTTPLPAHDVLETMSAMYHGVLPAFITTDIDLLKRSLERIHSIGFKKCELEAQTVNTTRTLRLIQEIPKLAAGLSSLGPLIYCVFEKTNRESMETLETISKQMDAKVLGVFSGCNSGFEVQSI